MRYQTALHPEPIELYKSKKEYSQIIKIYMKNLSTYLSTAPVISTLWIVLIASLLIEINRFFPDSLSL